MYDVAIVGAGVSGIFSALELSRLQHNNIIIFEQVKRLHDSRNVSNGWFGGSAKSELRLFDSSGFGGNILTPRLYKAVVSHLEANCDGKFKLDKNKLLKKDLKRLEDLGFTVLEPETRLVSSDRMVSIESSVQKLLQTQIEINSDCKVTQIRKAKRHFELLDEDGKIYFAKKVIVSAGRSGASWAAEAMAELPLGHACNSFELGVRLEIPTRQLSGLSSTNFALKFGEFRTSMMLRSCFIEMDNMADFKTANARCLSGKATQSTSMSLYRRFSSNNALYDCQRLVRIANVLGDDQLIREPASRWLSNTHILAPMPEYSTLIPGIEQACRAFPRGSRRVSIYSPDARLNMVKYKLTPGMESTVRGLYIVGDMSGHTSSFAQAAASGVLSARDILKRT